MTFVGKWARYVHRYLGLASGLVLLVVCVSGGILLLRPEIERFWEPGKYRVLQSDASKRISLDLLIADVERFESATSDGGTVKIERATVPANPRETYLLTARVRKGGKSWIYSLYVDPYTGETLGYGASAAAPFFHLVRRFHRTLGLSPQIGRPIVGTATLILAFVLLSGLIRWFPTRRSRWNAWKNRLTPTLNRGKARALFDLHNVLGFYAALPLFLLAATGLWFSSFDWVRDVGGRFLNEPSVERRLYKSAPTPGAARTSAEEILARTRETSPRNENIEMSFPSLNSEEPFVVRKGGGRFFGSFRRDVYYWDAYRGTLLGSETPDALSWRSRVRTAILPLHTGVVWGTASRLFFFVVCVAASSLTITGYWLTFERWRRRAAANAKKKALTVDSIEKVPTTNGVDSK